MLIKMKMLFIASVVAVFSTANAGAAPSAHVNPIFRGVLPQQTARKDARTGGAPASCFSSRPKGYAVCLA